MLADDAPFPDPARLLIVPDHYLTRMLLSQGIPPGRAGRARASTASPVETDGRTIWRTVRRALAPVPRHPVAAVAGADASPTVFGVDTPLRPGRPPTRSTTRWPRGWPSPSSGPRALFERFNIEVLATTESPLDDLAAHAKLAADGWGGPGGRVITTFRPDDVVDMEWAGWAERVARLGEITGEDTGTYAGYLDALRAAPGGVHRGRRHLAPTTATRPRARSALTAAEAAALYDRGAARRRPTPPTPRRSGRTC